MLIENSGLIILCGLPSSGKSWFAKLLADQLSIQLKTMNIQITDIDQVRSQLFDSNFLPENETFVRETALLQTREYLEANSIVIVDDINYFNSMRHEFKQIADEMSTFYLILYISTPLETCLKWNKKRTNCLEDHVITNIAEKFDIPGRKYLWDTPFDAIDVSTDDSSKKITSITSHVVELVHNEKSSTEKDTFTDSVSVRHDVDHLTRMFINFYANTVFKSHENEFVEENSTDKLSTFKKSIGKIIAHPLFIQIQNVYSHNIGKMNTLRRKYVKKYMENTQSDEYFLSKGISEKNLVYLLVDFMEFLLK